MKRVLIAIVLLVGVRLAVAAPDPAADSAPAAPVRTYYPPVARLDEPARLSDGGNLKLPPLVIPADPRPVDRRPIYIGAGLLAIALIAWFNRRNRAVLDDDDRSARAAGRDRVRRARGVTRDGDDADDLHAAADAPAADAPAADAPPTDVAPTRPEDPDDR